MTCCTSMQWCTANGSKVCMLFRPYQQVSRQLPAHLRAPYQCSLLRLQGIVGSTPWNALVFATFYFQLLGFSDLQASVLLAAFLAANAVGAALELSVRQWLPIGLRRHVLLPLLVLLACARTNSWWPIWLAQQPWACPACLHALPLTACHCLYLILTGGLLGGFLGDWAAQRWPDHGRIVVCQISVVVGVPLSFLLFKARLSACFSGPGCLSKRGRLHHALCTAGWLQLTYIG